MSEKGEVAAELRRIREGVEGRALSGKPLAVAAGLPVRTPQPMPKDPLPEPVPLPARPSNDALNALWPLQEVAGGGGVRRLLARTLGRVLARLITRQESFNARQVQFDNEILDYIDARVAATHRHYDAVLGIHGRHMGEIDERHLILQEELVAHVHDLVRRIDLALAQGERSRLSLEFTLRDLRARLLALEERLPAP